MIQSVAVIGTGVIGTGWALRCLASGRRVEAFDPSPNFKARLADEIHRLWPVLEKRGLAQHLSLIHI